ncbi:MAG TPA: ElyC/SanA/YdcF family protein, partial [Polyangiaceae bacterium]
ASDARTPDPYFACGLPRADVVAVARHDAHVLRTLATRNGASPYAAVIVPGHGLPEQDASPLRSYSPADPSACKALAGPSFGALGAMIQRTRRASALLRNGVAPLAIVSGGAVHSRLVEAFAMLHLLSCARPDGGELVDADRVFVEPCADHTHTNLRNAGRVLAAMHARAGFLVTDDHFQSDYFEDQTGLEIVGGSVDQRSLRDFGYLVGSWRLASTGNEAGFWFTPYRFWAEPREGLGSVSCDDR